MRELFRRYCLASAASTRVEKVFSDAGNLATKKRSGFSCAQVGGKVQYKHNDKLVGDYSKGKEKEEKEE